MRSETCLTPSAVWKTVTQNGASAADLLGGSVFVQHAIRHAVPDHAGRRHLHQFRDAYQNDTVSNSGRANGLLSETTGGGKRHGEQFRHE